MNTSPLGRIPSELRFQIFELALTRDTTINLAHRRQHAQLLETCTQVRREALPIFYGCNSFSHSFHPGQHPLRSDILSLVKHLKCLGPRALDSMSRIHFEWMRYSVEYTSALQSMTIHQASFVEGQTITNRKGHPARHFRPAHVESEIVEIYRSMGVLLCPGKEEGCWMLMPANGQSTNVPPKMEFWSSVWDAEADTLQDPEYWKRDQAKELLRMLCRSSSIAEDLEGEDF